MNNIKGIQYYEDLKRARYEKHCEICDKPMEFSGFPTKLGKEVGEMFVCVGSNGYVMHQITIIYPECKNYFSWMGITKDKKGGEQE